MLEARSSTINMELNQADLELISDARIVDAVENVLLAKVTWDEQRELKHQEELERRTRREERRQRRLSERYAEEIRRVEAELEEERRRGEAALQDAKSREERAKATAEALTKQLRTAEKLGSNKKERKRLLASVKEKLKEQRMAAAQVVAANKKLTEERRKGEERVAAITRRYEDDKKRVQEQVITFTLCLEQRNRQLLTEVTSRLDEGRMREAVETLHEDFNVRLLGVDCGLRFLMEAPASEWTHVVDRQVDLRKVVERLFSDSVRQEVTWAEVTRCSHQTKDLALQCGAPLPTQVEKRHFDPLAATPRRVFVSKPSSVDDTALIGPYITSAIVTDDGRLVMTDLNNTMVKVLDLNNRDVIRGVKLDVTPYRLALLPDGLVAVTSSSKTLHLVDVTGDVSFVGRVRTARQYWGVSGGVGEDNLIVSCWKEREGPACVDVITRAGEVVHIVINSRLLKDMSYPRYVCVVGGDVLIADNDANSVFRVELATGCLVDTLTHPDLKRPRQVCADPSGNVYIACSGSHCVLVMSADGRWRRLLEKGQHKGGNYHVTPCGMCLTNTGLVVTWKGVPGRSVVVGYDLT
nr:hypothetical protein BaRGS_028029 [Batillaria attramentaria]